MKLKWRRDVWPPARPPGLSVLLSHWPGYLSLENQHTDTACPQPWGSEGLGPTAQPAVTPLRVQVGRGRLLPSVKHPLSTRLPLLPSGLRKSAPHPLPRRSSRNGNVRNGQTPEAGSPRGQLQQAGEQQSRPSSRQAHGVPQHVHPWPPAEPPHLTGVIAFPGGKHPGGWPTPLPKHTGVSPWAASSELWGAVVKDESRESATGETP